MSLPRALSKLGYCSRGQAFRLVRGGVVEVNGGIERDTGRRVNLTVDHISVEGKQVYQAIQCYIMLNKPKGLVTTTTDERKRETVYKCLDQAHLPKLMPVGRLDKASEGMLLFSNDTAWANRITAPASHLEKIYHVQINRVCDTNLLQNISRGIKTNEGKVLKAKQVRILRCGGKTSWLEIILDEGRNRHIRRILENLGIDVLRLIRVAIGPLQLGNLIKGQFRYLTNKELASIKNSLTIKGYSGNG